MEHFWTSVDGGARCSVWFPNAKVSDGSQPPAASATPLGVPAGARSLDRLVRVSDSWVPGNAAERCRPVASHLGMARALNWSYGEP